MAAPYTGATFKAMVYDHLNRSTLSGRSTSADLVADFCDLAIKEMEKKKFWFQLVHQATVATTAHTGYTSLPTDFLFETEKEVGETLIMPPSNYYLTKVDYPTIIYFQNAGATEEQPYYFAIMDKIYWYPIPDQVYSPAMSYYKHLGFPADGASNDWTNTVWDLTFWAVLEEAWRYIGNDAEMAKARERKEKKLTEYENQHGQRQSTGRIRLTSF